MQAISFGPIQALYCRKTCSDSRLSASETATSLFYKNAPTAGIRSGNCFSDYIRNRFQYVSAPFPANKNLFETVVPERSEAKKAWNHCHSSQPGSSKTSQQISTIAYA